MGIGSHSRGLSIKEGKELLKLTVSVDMRRNGAHLTEKQKKDSINLSDILNNFPQGVQGPQVNLILKWNLWEYEKNPLWITYSRKTRDDNFKNPMHFCLLGEKENAHAFLQKLH